MTLEILNGGIQLLGVANIDNYLENKHLEADDDWSLLLFNEAGDPISARRISNPYHYSPILSADQALPMVVKIPRLDGLAAVGIYNQYREAQLRIPVDTPFRVQAAANRQQFLAHDRENRRLLLEQERMRRRSAARAILEIKETPQLENMPEDMRKAIHGGIAFEMERLVELGPEIMNLGRSLALEPEEIARQMMPGSPLPASPALALQSFPADKAYTLSGRITDLDTGTPVVGAALDFSQYNTANQYQGYLGRQTTGASGYYSIRVDPGYISITADYSAVAAGRYLRKIESVRIDGHTTFDMKAIPGILLSGTVTNSQGQGVAGVTLRAFSHELQLSVNGPSGSTGGYSVIVPGNRTLEISLSTPVPYVPPPIEQGVVFTADTVRDFRVETGWLVSGTVWGDVRAEISRASVLLRQLTSTTTTSPYWSASTDTRGRYTFAVSKKLDPNSFIIAAYAANYVLQSASLTLTKDTTFDFQLLKGNTVSGTARDNAEKAVSGVRVRAYQGGMFVASALTKADGTYAFDLAAGIYEIEALPPAQSTLAPAAAKNVLVNEPRTVNLVLAPAPGIVTVNLYYPDQETYTRFSNRSFTRFELYQSGRTVYTTGGVQGSGGLDPARGKYFRPYNLYVNGGQYALLAFLMGCQPIPVSNLEVSSSTAISIDVPKPFLWAGVLRGADNAPLAGMNIQSYNDLVNASEVTTTNSSGQFNIFLTPNGFAKFFTNQGSSNILHTERFGNVTESRNTDCVLDLFPSFSDSGSTLTQMFGVADRMLRWNIVMIGDGYTGIDEMYTDANKNGQWDGVIYHDLNGNGVWDTGEPYQRYGNAPAPVAGLNPTKTNESFTDLNGDAFPNLHDQELFDRNTLDTARSLFGQDEWRRHREAFNIFRIRVISNQGGHKIKDSNGKVVIDRDTALGAVVDTPDRGYLLNINGTLVSQYVNQYVPECDTRIVLINQPVRFGRANSYILTYGGEVTTLGNDYVIAHEMGHNVGLLADEYTEYQENYRGAESFSRNITTLFDPSRIPWRHLIRAGKEIPSVPGSSGVGLYEGAGYYTGGRYRPTEFCMMVSGNRYCPVCTEETEIRLRDITGEVPTATPHFPTQTVSGLYPEFGWDAIMGISHFLFELEKADGSQLVASYDVYNTSFALPFALAEGTEYRWRIRPASTSSWGSWTSWTYFRPHSPTPVFTGIFAQIAAGGGYQTTLTGVNLGEATANVLVSLIRSDGTPFNGTTSAAAEPVNINIKPMGTARLDAALPGAAVAGYARLSSNMLINGTALFKTLSGSLVLSEAGVGLSKAGKVFAIYVDNTNDALSGYAVVNPGPTPTNLRLTLRDASGMLREIQSLTLGAGQHLAQFAHERFAAASAGFEGSIEFSSDQDVASVAVRFDNVSADSSSRIFSTIPVSVDEPGTTFYFPQVADGGGYRTNFILFNASGTATSAKLEFFSSSGAALALPIGGIAKTGHDVPLTAKGVARFLTDGTSSDIKVGWVKVTCPIAITGSSIFQTRSGNRILSEAGVGSAPPVRRLVALVESRGYTQSGIALCNPNSSAVTLTLNLRNSLGEFAATTTLTLPANGHLAKFFTEWFPYGFGGFEGTLEVLATEPVSAVALRYDNPRANVFATLPVVVLP